MLTKLNSKPVLANRCGGTFLMDGPYLKSEFVPMIDLGSVATSTFGQQRRTIQIPITITLNESTSNSRPKGRRLATQQSGKLGLSLRAKKRIQANQMA